MARRPRRHAPSITSKATWGGSIASSTPTAKMINGNGTISTTNPVQWAPPALSWSGFGAFPALSGIAVDEVVGQPATTAAVSNYIAYQRLDFGSGRDIQPHGQLRLSLSVRRRA